MASRAGRRTRPHDAGRDERDADAGAGQLDRRLPNSRAPTSSPYIPTRPARDATGWSRRSRCARGPFDHSRQHRASEPYRRDEVHATSSSMRSWAFRRSDPRSRARVVHQRPGLATRRRARARLDRGRPPPWSAREPSRPASDRPAPAGGFHQGSRRANWNARCGDPADAPVTSTTAPRLRPGRYPDAGFAGPPDAARDSIHRTSARVRAERPWGQRSVTFRPPSHVDAPTERRRRRVAGTVPP
jgi:hypothetical protein